MAWTVPITWTPTAVLTAAQLNQQLRDNYLETMPAKATAAGRFFTTSAVNTITEREVVTATVATSETTTSTSYTNLATVGPSVTVTTGEKAIVSSMVTTFNTGTGAAGRCAVSYQINGVGGSDSTSSIAESIVANGRYRLMLTEIAGGLTPGSNTFKLVYRVTGGTGTFLDRDLTVIPL